VGEPRLHNSLHRQVLCDALWEAGNPLRLLLQNRFLKCVTNVIDLGVARSSSISHSAHYHPHYEQEYWRPKQHACAAAFATALGQSQGHFYGLFIGYVFDVR
jgi:hypothetical protein